MLDTHETQMYNWQKTTSWGCTAHSIPKQLYFHTQNGGNRTQKRLGTAMYVVLAGCDRKKHTSEQGMDKWIPEAGDFGVDEQQHA